MGKLYWCVNCEESNVHDKQRHHYEKHLEMPYNDKFFKPVCDYRNITKIRCLLCGYIVESDQYNRRMKIHANIFHPDRMRLTDVFDPASASRCVAIKCSHCKRFIERGRLKKVPKCPHGSLYDDPNDSLAKIENERTNETRKRIAENDISVRENKIFKGSVKTSATSKTVEREPSDERFTNCNICQKKLKTSVLDQHMRRKHIEEALVPNVSPAETENGRPNEIRKRDAENNTSERKIGIFKENVKTEATSTTAELEPSDEAFTNCNICQNRIKTSAMDQHMRRKHLEKAIVLDSDSDNDEKPKIKVEKDAGHSAVATLDSDSDHEDKPKIKVEKNAGHSTVTTPTPIPKEIRSNESNERSNQKPNDSETEFYPLRISKSELERFLLAKRIYPKNGNFYLKDS